MNLRFYDEYRTVNNSTVRTVLVLLYCTVLLMLLLLIDSACGGSSGVDFFFIFLFMLDFFVFFLRERRLCFSYRLMISLNNSNCFGFAGLNTLNSCRWLEASLRQLLPRPPKGLLPVCTFAPLLMISSRHQTN